MGALIGAGIGGHLFEKGLVEAARGLRVATATIGMTIAAFATSAPEFFVGLSSAVEGSPEIALGDALGSNVVNFGLVLGLVAAIWTVKTTRDFSQTDIPIATATPLFVMLLSFDGVISRMDGFVLVAIFILWLLGTVFRAQKQRGKKRKMVSLSKSLRISTSIIVGIVLLAVAGRLAVIAATGLAKEFGLNQFFVGATMVAFGTSVPELATTLISQIRGRGEIGYGTLLGSNLFNGLFIVGTVATIHPIIVDRAPLSVGIGFGFLTVLCSLPRAVGLVSRMQGMVLLLSYAAYVLILFNFR